MISSHRLSSLAFPLLSVLGSAMLAIVLPTSLQAQRPALTKDVDARGRIPYVQTFARTQDLYCSGTNTDTCRVSFDAVPAGYRLVVEQVTAAFSSYTSVGGETAPGHVYLSDGSVSIPLANPALRQAGGGFQDDLLFTPVTFYIEAGAKPTVSVVAPLSNVRAPLLIHNLDHSFSVSVIGYLIATS